VALGYEGDVRKLKEPNDPALKDNTASEAGRRNGKKNCDQEYTPSEQLRIFTIVGRAERKGEGAMKKEAAAGTEGASKLLSSGKDQKHFTQPENKGYQGKGSGARAVSRRQLCAARSELGLLTDRKLNSIGRRGKRGWARGKGTTQNKRGIRHSDTSQGML